MPRFLHKLYPLVAPVALSSLVVGCAGTAAPVATQATGVQKELGTLREQTSAQASRISELEARLALLESEARSVRRVKPRETVVISRHNRQQRREAQPEIEQEREPAPVSLVLDGRRSRASSEMESLPPLPAGPIPGLGVVPLPGQQSSAPAPVMSTPKEQYRDALALLRARNFDGAIAAFDALLLRHPGHVLTAGAVHWKGEAQYAKRAYRDALTTFTRVVDEFPKSAKRSDALLKVAMCHRRLGDEELARVFFRRVRQEFPKSDAARVASGEGAS